jgi:hypothetical protein
VAVAGKGKKSGASAKKELVAKRGVAVGKKLEIRTLVKAEKNQASGSGPQAFVPKEVLSKAVLKTETPRTKELSVKEEKKLHIKAKAKKKPKPAKPEFKPEDLDKDLDSYMAAAPDVPVVA